MRQERTTKIKFTDARVRALTPPDTGQVLVWDSEFRGFGVRVTPNGTKSWIVQSKVNRKTRRATLGRCDRIPLKGQDESGREIGARHRARQKLLEMADGVDPQESRRIKDAQQVTLREAAEDYLENNRTKNGPLRPNTKRDIQRCIDKSFYEWGEMPVAQLTRAMCQKKFEDLSKVAQVQANRDFRYLRAILNRARENSSTEEGQYTILPINPVTHLFRKNGLVKWNPVGKSKAKIPEDEIGAVFNLLVRLADQNENIETMYTSADLILFLLLTGCRVGEARSLTWDRVDLDAKVPTFHLPSHIVKNHRGVTLPVSDQCTCGFRSTTTITSKKIVYTPVPRKKSAPIRGAANAQRNRTQKSRRGNAFS